MKSEMILKPATKTADTATSTVSKKGVEKVHLHCLIGQSGDTLGASTYIQLVLQHSSDGSTWSAVTDNAYVRGGSVDGNGVWAKIDSSAKDEMMYSIVYVGDRPYVRVLFDFVGTHSNGTPIGAVAVRELVKYEGGTGLLPQL